MITYNFRRFIIILILILLSLFSSAQPIQKQWDARFGGRQLNVFRQSVVNPDGTTLLCGITRSGATGSITTPKRNPNNVDDLDVWIVKTNALGQELWQKRFGGTRNDDLYDVIRCSSGGYLLMMTTYSGKGFEKSEDLRGGVNSQDSSDVWLLRIDEDGNKLWDKSLGGSNNDVAQTGIELANGDFFLVCGTQSEKGYDVSDPNPYRSAFMWLIKIDANGNKIWDKKISPTLSPSNRRSKLIRDTDSTFVLGRGSIRYEFIRLDTSGKFYSRIIYKNDTEAIFKDIVKTQDGNYVLFGTGYTGTNTDKTDPGYGFADYWAIKVDPQGNRIWDKAYGGQGIEFAGAIAETEDGGLIMVGGSQSIRSGNKETNLLRAGATFFSDAWGVRTDKDGNKLFEISYRGTLSESFDRITYVDSNNIYISGTIGSNKSDDITAAPQSSSDYGMVKYTYKDTSSTGPNSVFEISNKKVSVYPNPTKQNFTVSFNEVIDEYSLSLFDITGKEIQLKNISKTSNSQLGVKLPNLPNGIYVIKGSLNHNKLFSKRVVIN